MAEWRLARGWSEEGLEARLEALDSLPLNFSTRLEQMTPANGWSRFRSGAAIATEAAGPPLPGGAFERACQLVADFEFSDPRIVTAHFDDRAPLLGRRMLLELKPLALRYLCGTVVEEVIDKAMPDRTVFGFRYSTLQGHLEAGTEWFRLEKDHATGRIHFSIHALWKRGEMPNWWSAVGFRLLVRRYQRAWHRLAYLRLRTMLGATGLPPLPHPDRLIHEGRELPGPAVQRVAIGGPPEGVDGEIEEPGYTRPLLRALALGASAGMRSLLAPSFVVCDRPRRRLVRVGAAAELVADKLPFTPPRTQPPSVLFRILSGAACGWLVSRRTAPTFVGGVAALASTFFMRRTREELARKKGWSNPLAGGVEDLVAGALAAAAVR